MNSLIRLILCYIQLFGRHMNLRTGRVQGQNLQTCSTFFFTLYRHLCNIDILRHAQFLVKQLKTRNTKGYQDRGCVRIAWVSRVYFVPYLSVLRTCVNPWEIAKCLNANALFFWWLNHFTSASHLDIRNSEERRRWTHWKGSSIFTAAPRDCARIRQTPNPEDLGEEEARRGLVLFGQASSFDTSLFF